MDSAEFRQLVWQQTKTDAKAFLGFGIEKVYFQVLAHAVIFGLLALFGLVAFVGGELLALGAAVAAYLTFASGVLIWKRIGAPVRVYANLDSAWQKRFGEVKDRLDSLEGEFRSLPRPEFSLDNGYEGWWLEIRNHSADAIYKVKIDFEETSYVAFKDYALDAQWPKKSEDTERRIQEGGRDRIFLYGVERDHGINRCFFRFLTNGKRQKMYGRTSWSDASEPPVPVSASDKGILKVIVTSSPRMQGGARVLRFRFDGDVFESITDEVLAIQ